MNAAPYISVSEFQTNNPELDFSAYADTTVSGMIARASAHVDAFLHYSLGVENLSNELTDAYADTDGNLKIFTRKIPIVSVSSLQLKLGTYSTSLSLTDSAGNARYDVPDPQHHILYPYQEIATTGTVSINNFFQIRDRTLFVRVSYRAGYTTIPDDIKDAVNLLTKDIFVRQSNPMNLASVSQGGISMTHGQKTGGKSDLVLQAEAMLQPYRRVIA